MTDVILRISGMDCGALVMLVFSLGTVPLLFLFGALQSFLPRGWMKYIVKGIRLFGM